MYKNSDVSQLGSTELLRRYQDGDAFLNSLLTCDETWVHHFTPEIKKIKSRVAFPETVKSAQFSR
jgi:hypothetical protein